MKKLTPGTKIDSFKVPLFLFFLVSATLIAYTKTAGNDFINFDDSLQLTNQYHVLSGLTWDNFLWSFGPHSWCSPLTWFSYTLCFELFGLNAGAFHIMSLIIHIAGSVLLFIALRLMTGTFWKSAFVSSLFAIHPVNVESVAWVAELNNVLSGLFFMLTLIAYYFYTLKTDWKRYLSTLLIFCLGLLAKPSLMTLPFILLLIDVWPLKRIVLERTGDNGIVPRITTATEPLQHILTEKIPFLIMAAASFIANLHGANVRMGLYNQEMTSIGLRVSNGLVSIVKYMGNLVWPHKLAIFYPYPGSIPWWHTTGALLLLSLITAYALRQFFKKPYYLVGWLWFLGTLIPFLGFFQAGLWPELADRYAYLSTIGLFMAIAWGVQDAWVEWKLPRSAFPIIGTGIILIFMILTRTQVGYWKNSETLFDYTLKVTSGNFVAHNSLGVAKLDKGEFQGAADQFQQSITIKPTYQDAHFNLGIALYSMQRYDEAEAAFLKCISINPREASSYGSLGHVMMEKGNFDQAIINFNKSLELNPYQEKIWCRLGEAYAKRGNLQKAIACYSESARLNPNFHTAVQELAKARDTQGKYNEAAAKLQDMLKADPENPEVMTKLGDILSRSGKLSEAATLYQKSISLNPKSTQALYGLVVMYSNNMEYAKSLEVLERMRQIQPDNPDIYYNVACIYSRQNMADKSVAWLKAAFEKGFNRVDMIMNDPDLANIRNTPFVNNLKKSE